MRRCDPDGRSEGYLSRRIGKSHIPEKSPGKRNFVASTFWEIPSTIQKPSGGTYPGIPAIEGEIKRISSNIQNFVAAPEGLLCPRIEGVAGDHLRPPRKVARLPHCKRLWNASLLQKSLAIRRIAHYDSIQLWNDLMNVLPMDGTARWRRDATNRLLL
jgi:hypothetical protein